MNFSTPMNKERLTTSTPILLALLAITFLVLRIAVWYIEISRNDEGIGIQWDAPAKVDLTGRDYQSKLVLYYFSAPGYEACRTLNNTTLLNKNIVKLVNDEFLPIKIENQSADEDTELGKVKKDLQQKFLVFVFPTLVVTLPSGKQVDTQNAYAGVSAKQFLRFLERCQKKEGYERGVDYLGHAKYVEAARAFESWLGSPNNSKQDAVDGALYCALAYVMLGDNRQAQVVIDQAFKNKQYAVEKKWPKPLAEFLLGEIDGERLMKACDHEGSRDPRAYYFMGMLNLKQGNVPGAVENFKLAERGTYTASEIYGLVNGQLNMISQQ